MPTDRPAPARAPRRAVLGVILPLLGAVLSGAGAASAGPAQWAPFPVFEWTPPFDMASPRKERMYVPLDRAERDWRLCVSFPHLKDAYWLGVNYGLVDEAQRLGVGLHLYDAGGYDHLQTQVRQIEACVADKASAVIVAGIDADGLNDVLGRVHAAGIPIVDLVNGVSFARLDAKSLIDFYDSGFAAGRYIADRHKGEQRSISVLWFPGPKGASWVTRGNQGFVDALKDSNVKIVETAHGDTGKRTQARLIQAALERFP
ncbi:MAG: TMAO reductase system periplasmic protein TorT, partial [Hyphomicrobiales bacterium]|nr:TMAO reductase system periplasmic protein TorT [Hyphomicrobiales bacterium]